MANERRLFVVIEHGRSPVHKYVGEVDVYADERPVPVVAATGDRPMYRIWNPIRVVNDAWDLLPSEDPRKPGLKITCHTPAFLPVSSVEQREWVEVPVHSFESCGEAMTRAYLAALAGTAVAMRNRAERVVAQMEEEAKREIDRDRAEQANLIVVPGQEGERAAASIADIQTRLRGGGGSA